MKKILPLLFILSCFIACQEEPGKSPEETVRIWQEHMDRNEFDAAKKLSTPSGKKVIEDIEVLLNMGSEPIPIDTTEFVVMNCVENGDEAVCRYTEKIKEEYFRRGAEIVKIDEELISDSFLLKKINGYWLIDLPDEPLDGDDELKDLFNELLEEENL